MKDKLYILFYNFLVLPVLLLAFHLAGIFDPKVRRGVLGRYRCLQDAQAFLRSRRSDCDETFLVHCSSMGEFEHIKILLRELKVRRPGCCIIVMFFSPSGYENVRHNPHADLYLYAPFDEWFTVRRLLKLLRPRALIVAKYDVWPNQVWGARALGVSTFLVNATISASSRRLQWPVRWFQKSVYRAFNRILAISDEDRRHYLKLTNRENVKVVGDTKFDQVIQRREEARSHHHFPEGLLAGKTVLVAGSTWPEDESRLVPACKELMARYPEFLVIFCPHEPTAEHLSALEKSCAPFLTVRYSALSSYQEEKIILIDQIGMLANLYSLARIAYVGGGFKQNVHNVLEPAVFGLPVLMGPRIQKSREARLLIAGGGGTVVHSPEEILTAIGRLLDDPSLWERQAAAACKVVEDHCGATSRTLDAILNALPAISRSGATQPTASR